MRKIAIQLRTATLASMASLIASTAGVLAAEPRAFVCNFLQGTIAEYEHAWTARPTTDRLDFTYASFDRERGTAEFIGNVGATSVLFWKGAWTWNFVEITDSGNAMMTTVFSSSDGQRHPAVHSRHTALAGDVAIPSHYRGICVAR
jgi:hypothetical protein